MKQLSLFPETDPRPPVTKTWNLWHGCTRASAGCANCYMFRRDESVGGESGPNARPCDYEWVLALHDQCAGYGAGFFYHQTGALLIKDGKEYRIPRRLQHSQARKADLDL